MSTDALKKSNTLDKKELSKEREAVVAFMIWFPFLFFGGLALMNGMRKYPGLTIWKIAAILLVLLGLVCGIAGIIALRRLTVTAYKEANKYFAIYTVSILLGYFSIGIVTIIALLKLWFDVRKLLNYSN